MRAFAAAVTTSFGSSTKRPGHDAGHPWVRSPVSPPQWPPIEAIRRSWRDMIDPQLGGDARYAKTWGINTPAGQDGSSRDLSGENQDALYLPRGHLGHPLRQHR